MYSQVACGAVLFLVLGGSVPGQSDDRPRLQPVPNSDTGMKTGPETGARIPDFRLPDQHGREQTFDTLKGPNGLVLLVVRSADW